MEDNIQQIRRANDLSPRQSLKLGGKKTKDILPLQVRTKINEERVLEIEQ